MSIGQKSVVGAFVVLGVAVVVFSIIIFITGIVDGWLFSDPFDTVMGLLLLVFTIGPFVAIAGVYAWRRADAEGRSVDTARKMIVRDTLYIAGMGGLMFWTIIAYWASEIRDWQGGAPRAA